MKTMQDFHNWLSEKESALPDQIRFNDLTRVSRVRLVEVSSVGPWWIWDAQEPVLG